MTRAQAESMLEMVRRDWGNRRKVSGGIKIAEGSLAAIKLDTQGFFS